MTEKIRYIENLIGKKIPTEVFGILLPIIERYKTKDLKVIVDKFKLNR